LGPISLLLETVTKQLTLDPKRDNQQFGKLPIAGVIAVSDSWEIEQLSELRPRLKPLTLKAAESWTTVLVMNFL
jgi:hypothetical protein